jgi:hypothetical protein
MTSCGAEIQQSKCHPAKAGLARAVPNPAKESKNKQINQEGQLLSQIPALLCKNASTKYLVLFFLT